MSVLGTTVFKVPNLGEQGFKLDQAQAQQQRQRQSLVQKQLNATGAEKAYAETGMGLTGRWKQMADGYYDIWKDASIQYEITGSAADKAAMESAGRNLAYASTAGGTILQTGGQYYQKNKAEGFKNVNATVESAGDLYSGFAFGEFNKGDIVRKGNELYVKDGETFKPATQSTYLASSPNLNNSFMLPSVIKQGKFVNPQSFVSEFSGTITAGSSIPNAQSRMNTMYDQNLKNDEFVKDVVTAFAISKDDGLGMVEDPSKLDADTYAEIMGLMENEKIVDQAVEWYRGIVQSSVPPLWKASKSNSFSINVGEGTKTDLTYRKNVGIPLYTGSEEEGAATGADVKLEGYLGFPKTGGIIPKGYADPDGNKYDIVGVGVKDGKLMAQRVVGEGSDFMSFEQGRKYKTQIGEMTVDEWEGVPVATKKEIIAELEKQGIDINDLIDLKGTGGSSGVSGSTFDPNSYKK